MEWFQQLYDEFRMKTGFGGVTDEQTEKEVDFICDAMNLRKEAKILDLFCGTGRHSIEMARRGHRVTGIELNPDYLRLGRAKAGNESFAPLFIQGDVRTVPFGENYDAAIIMFHSFGYFSDEEDEAVLKKIHDALRKGGKLLIEIINRDWVLKNFAEREESVKNGIRVVEKRHFDILTSRNQFTIERHEGGEVIIRKGSWRLYSAHEMNNLLEKIGFRLLAAFANLDKEPLTKDSRLMRMVFEKQ